ncbi:MAG: hypothetical protein ACYDCC_07855 [Actinomycetota bacterium]
MPLVISQDLTLINLHIVLDGSLIVLPGAKLSLYGVTLEIHNDPYRAIVTSTLLYGNCSVGVGLPLIGCAGTAYLPWDAYYVDSTFASIWNFAYIQAWVLLHNYAPMPWPPPNPPLQTYPTAEQVSSKFQSDIPQNQIDVNGELDTYDLSQFPLPAGQQFESRRTRIMAQRDPIGTPVQLFGPYALVAAPQYGSTVGGTLNFQHTDVENGSMVLASSTAQFVDVTITGDELGSSCHVCASSSSVSVSNSKISSSNMGYGCELCVSGGSLNFSSSDVSIADAGACYCSITGIGSSGTNVAIVDATLTGRSTTQTWNDVAISLGTSPATSATVTRSTFRRWNVNVTDSNYGPQTQIPSPGTTTISSNDISCDRQCVGIKYTQGTQGWGFPAPTDIANNTVSGSPGMGQTGISAGGDGSPSDAPLQLRGNSISGLGGSGQGIVLAYLGAGRIEPQVTGNTISGGEDVGLQLGTRTLDPSVSIPLTVAAVSDNTVNNNATGISVSWDARESIPLMARNEVNGINVDGTINPSQQVYFYRADNQTIADRHADSNSAAGYHGFLTAEGLLTVYDSSNFAIAGPDLSKNTNGIVMVKTTGSISNGALHDNASNGLLGFYSGVAVDGNTHQRNAASGVSLVSSAPSTLPSLDSNLASENGTGIKLDHVSPDVTNNTVNSNGTGVGLTFASPTVASLTASQNQTGITLKTSSPRISSSTVSNGSAGIVMDDSAPTIQGGTVSGNSSDGFELFGSSPAIAGVNVSNNGGWGLIANQSRDCYYSCSGSSPDISGSTFHANTAGGLEVNYGSPTVSNSILSNNGPYGIFVYSVGTSAPKIMNSCISGHTTAGIFSNDVVHTTDARSNYWGSASGPSGVGSGTGDAVSLNVAYSPWLSTCPV